MSAVIDAAALAAAPKTLERGRLYAVPDGAGGLEVVDLERYGETPSRMRGTVVTRDAQSFLKYFADHVMDWSRIYVDRNPDKPHIEAVLDAHASGEGRAGRHEHRVALEFRVTPEWNIWLGHSGKAMAQGVFAEFVEDNVKDIAEPSGATMLEIAQHMQAAKDTTFQSAVRLHDGQVRFTHAENLTSSYGGGPLAVPQKFILGIAPFEGNAPFRIEARFRWRFADGRLSFMYVVQRPSDVVKAGIAEFVDAIAEARAGMILYGTPMTAAAAIGL